MEKEPLEIRDGITLFKGRISRNLLVDPMVSHTYFLEDGEEAVIFDPSCGDEIAKRVEAHINKRRREDPGWKRALVIAGHSHIDHADNFYLGDVMGVEETRIYVHESGFRDGEVMNDPVPFIEKALDEMKGYYQIYFSFYLPYSLLMYPLAALDAAAPELAKKIFSRIGSLTFPAPHDGSIPPEPLKEEELEEMDLGGVEFKGWKLGDKVVLPTPGHSPCSISLLWPERKAVLVSDADWIGNPVFMSSSLRDCISSLETIKELTGAGIVDLLLPAHGEAKEGEDDILAHLDFHIRRLQLMRVEVLSLCRSSGERDVRRLTRMLVDGSPLFKALKQGNYPRVVIFVHNIVALCLKEEGLLD